MALPIKELTAEAFAPYGRVVDRPPTSPAAEGAGWRWWGETELLPETGRPYGVGYLQLRPAALSFDWAERHMESVEAIVPLGGDCLVYVGPPDHPEEPERLPPLTRFEAFRVRSGQAVLLAPGVWHGAPLAVDRPLAALVLVRQGTGAEDVTVASFVDTPVRIAGRRGADPQGGTQDARR